jgi:hypothetical protein
MLISHKYKFLFVAVPKTATTSIQECLLEFGDCELVPPKHKYAKQAKAELAPEIWDEYFKFAFVRNPYDWMLSWYFYRQRPQFREGKGHQRYTGNTSFEDFIRFDKEWPTTQIEFLTDDDGKCLVDFIGRYENLQHDFNVVCSQLDLPEFKLPARNVSANDVSPDRFYKGDLANIVKQRETWLIEKFNYQPSYKQDRLKGRSIFKYAKSKVRATLSKLRRSLF